MAQALLCSCLQYPGLLFLGVCFDIMVDNLIASLNSWTEKTNEVHDELHKFFWR